MKLTAMLWAALTVVVGISLFLLKYEVQGLEDQLRGTYAKIEHDKTSIRVLEAEWTYLNDPGRLRRLSEQHLGFTAPIASQIITLSQLPYKNGEMPPMPEAVATPPAPPLSPSAPLREAAVGNAPTPTLSQLQQRVTYEVAAVNERPSAITASIARLQRLLPPTWTGTPIATRSLQEPLR